jgi:6-phosphofructokinase 1
MIKRIGVLTGGGDCPGLNPAIKWVCKTALDEELSARRGFDYELVGIREGWRGLVKYDHRRHPVLPARTDFGADDWARILVENEVRTWDRMGGTRLGSSRTNPFDARRPTFQTVLENFKHMELEALVAIGGEDTLGAAAKLTQLGVPVVGIPKTIDRDLQGTDYSLGFETAVNVIVEEVDRIRTTAHSHSRIFVVETMGRYTGHLALSGGLASGASLILIPEVPYDIDRVVERLQGRRDAGHRFSIVVVAEGAKEAGGDRLERRAHQLDGFGHPILGGVAAKLSRDIEHRMGVEVRWVNLSHLQRGGVPCAYDRRMARLFGVAAMDLIAGGHYGRMVVFKDGRVDSIPIPMTLADVNKVDVAERYDTEWLTAKWGVLD